MLKRSFMVFVTALAIVALNTGSAMAGDSFTKLGRGATNLLTGWVEVPKNMYATGTEQNAFAGITTGLFKGLGAGIVRTAAGAYDIVSFPFAAPVNYDPVLQPEYVF